MKYFILYFKYFLMHKIGIFALSTHCRGGGGWGPLQSATLFIKFPTKHNLSPGSHQIPTTSAGRGAGAQLHLCRATTTNKKWKKRGNENEKWKMYFQQITHKFYSCRFHAASAPQKICFIIWKSNGENGPNNNHSHSQNRWRGGVESQGRPRRQTKSGYTKKDKPPLRRMCWARGGRRTTDDGRVLSKSLRTTDCGRSSGPS